MNSFIEECKKLIRINSVTSNGNEEIANALLERLQEFGMKAQLQPVTHSLDDVSKRQFNVIGILGDPLVDKKTKKGLLLTSPIDTASPGIAANWTETDGNPFDPIVKNGRIYGLGSGAGKLDFLCKLNAVQKFREKKLKMPVYLVASCGEELGMFGSRYLIKSGILNPKYVLCGEPSDLSLIYAHKCLNLFKVRIDFQMVAKDARGFNRKVRITSKGRSSHGAYPARGTNAIHQLIDLVRESFAQGFDLKFTELSGGESPNKVPDLATTEFFLTSHQFEDYKRFFSEFLQQNGLESSFEMETSGAVDSGIRFLPDQLFECVARVTDHFRKLSNQLSKVKDDSYLPPHSTINFSQLRRTLSGMDLYFDMRMLPDQSTEVIETEIIKDIRAIAVDYPHMNIVPGRSRQNPSLNMTQDHDFVRLCRDALITAGRPVNFDKKSTSTEAAQYFHAGFEAVAFGPGVSMGNSHSPNEYNILEQLDQATLFYEKLIERVCL
jgi:acetylornithine deacetylase/succinyl-diaminopimelate desuccinylase-like protein